MKISLKTKFYVYILPILIILPILLYSVVTPYTQLKQAFQEFEVDAAQAIKAEEFAISIDIEHLELFRLLSESPNRKYDFSTNTQYMRYKQASQIVESQLHQLSTEIQQQTKPYSKEREVLDGIRVLHAQFKQQTAQVIALSTQEKKEEAMIMLGDQVDVLIDNSLIPEIEKFILLKEDSAKTHVPELIKTATRNGVLPIPGVQEATIRMLNHFQNSLEAQRISHLLDNLQSKVFEQVIEEGNKNYTARTRNTHIAQIQHIQKEIDLTLSNMRKRQSEEENFSELKLLEKIEQEYQKIIPLNTQAITLSEGGKRREALTLLSTDIDRKIQNSLDPLTNQLVQGDKRYIESLTNNLHKKLNNIVFLIYAVSIGIFLLGLGSLWKLSQDIINPIIKLRNATMQLSKGDFNARVQIPSKDEIGDLAATFNTMASKLNDYYTELEEKVKERTRALEASKQNLEKANIKLLSLDKLKDQFVSIASHELRTPLTGINGIVSMIFEGDYGKVPVNLKEPLDDIEKATKRLIHLVNDILNLSRIEAGRMKFALSEFSLNDDIREIIALLQPIAKDKKILLTAQKITDVKVQADEDKVKQILNNLFGNALKFTDHGSITVSIHQEGDLLKIFVTDSGIGIAEEDTKKLFRKFEQISSQQKERPNGTGLGLYISKQLAQKLGGDLWLEKSEEGKGSTFAFSLPVSGSETAKKIKKVIEHESDVHTDQKDMARA